MTYVLDLVVVSVEPARDHGYVYVALVDSDLEARKRSDTSAEARCGVALVVPDWDKGKFPLGRTIRTVMEVG